MKTFTAEKIALSLSQLNGLIKSVITDALTDLYWIVAEIADIKLNQKGHCYIELVEKEDISTIAQIRATIWSYEYRKISDKFTKATNEPLKRGMKILFQASVTFHEVFGLSLNIRDIDPAYTMGEMAKKKKEVIDRLRKEGLIELNKILELPPVAKRLAVISSPTAAGYGDFFSHLDNNPYGYRFIHVLFPASMQGQDAEDSIISAFLEIRRQKDRFDAVALIRGGGSVIDLNCFDGYSLSSTIARFPLPVITGIGHEKDDTVADIVAHTKMKTPTAVAEFLISGLHSFEERIIELGDRIIRYAGDLFYGEKNRLNSVAQRLAVIPVKHTALQNNRLIVLQKDISGCALNFLSGYKSRLDNLEQALKHLDPSNVLKRGYSITRHKGKIVKDANGLKIGSEIETKLYKGTVKSIIRSGKEHKENDKEYKSKRNDLLPGFD